LPASISALEIAWFSVTATHCEPVLYSRFPADSRLVILTPAMESLSRSAKVPKSEMARRLFVESSSTVMESFVEVGGSLAGVTLTVSV